MQSYTKGKQSYQTLKTKETKNPVNFLVINVSEFTHTKGKGERISEMNQGKDRTTDWLNLLKLTDVRNSQF